MLTMVGEARFDMAGAKVADDDDVDGNGADDLLVSAWSRQVDGVSPVAVYVVTGPQTGRVSLGSSVHRAVWHQ